MTRRPVQQARRATDRQYLGTWPTKEAFEWPPIRMTLGETLRFVGLVIGALIGFAAIVATGIVLSGLPR